MNMHVVALNLFAAAGAIRHEHLRQQQQLQAARQFVTAMFADAELNARLAAAKQDQDQGDGYDGWLSHGDRYREED